MHLAAAAVAPVTPGLDPAAVAAHLRMLHGLAQTSGVDGLLVLFAVGENPVTGRNEGPHVRHYRIGDVDQMIADALALAAIPHANVYAPWVVFHKTIERGKKGSECDIQAVLAFVLDQDHDTGRAGPLPCAPPYVIETSAGNHQAFYPLARALAPAEAKPIAQALADSVGCDVGTKDLAHVWRVPGLLNWPNRQKIARGRSPTPQLVRIATRWTGELIDPGVLGQRVPPATSTMHSGVTGGSIGKLLGSVDDLLARCGPALRKSITAPPEPNEDRSATAFSVICSLIRKGFTDLEIVRLIEAHPNGIGARYAEGKDLAADIRRAREKLGPGTAESDAEAQASAGGLRPNSAQAGQVIPLFCPADAANAPPRRYVWKGVLGAGEFSVVYGEPGCGKSFLATHISYSVAQGRRLFGRRVRQSAVVYAGLEGGAGLAKRVRALLREHDDAPAFRFVARPLNVRADPGSVAALIAAVRDIKAGLVIIDTLARAMAGGDENSSEDMGALITAFDRVRAETGAHVMVIHHSGKDSSRGSRGHSSLKGAADTEIEVTRADGARVVRVTKAKDDADGEQFVFDLEVVDLGVDEDGDPVTTCIVRERAGPEAAKVKSTSRLSPTLAGIFADIKELFAPPSPAQQVRPLPTMPPVMAVTRDQVRDALTTAGRFTLHDGKLTATDRSKLSQWLSGLKNAGAICMTDKWVWLP